MTKYLVDANLPRYFSLWAYPEYTFVTDIDPQWSDTDIWGFAKHNGFTIVTKDADFSDRVLLTGSGPHVIHICVGNMKMRELHSFLMRVWPTVCAVSREARLVKVYFERIEAID